MDDFEVFCRQAYLPPGASPSPTPAPPSGRCGSSMGARPKDSACTFRNTPLPAEKDFPRTPNRAPVNCDPHRYPGNRPRRGSVPVILVHERETHFTREPSAPGASPRPNSGCMSTSDRKSLLDRKSVHNQTSAISCENTGASGGGAVAVLGEDDELCALRTPSGPPACSPRPRMSRALRRGSVPDGLLGLGTGGDVDNMYRVRNFTRGRKGVVNHGDTYRARSPGDVAPGPGPGRRRHSELSGVENLSSLLPLYEKALAASRADSETSALSSIGEPDLDTYTVALLGAAEVGKTTLAKQFTTSEDLAVHAEDDDDDDDDDEDEEGEHDRSCDEQDGPDGGCGRAVSVLVDGEEHWVNLLDTTDQQWDAVPDADAYMVVYSVADRKSLSVARETLARLAQDSQFCHAPVILVANKQDMVRKRVVTIPEGKQLAVEYACKYCETSACLNHGVDQLLVGVVSQIKLRAQSRDARNSDRGKREERSLTRVFGKLFHNRRRKSLLRSCDNLFIK